MREFRILAPKLLDPMQADSKVGTASFAVCPDGVG